MSLRFGKHELFWGSALVLACLCGACSDAPAPSPTPPVSTQRTNALAVVGDAVITPADLNEAMSKRGAARFQTLESREALLQQLVHQALQVQAAKAAGYDRAPEVVAAHQRALVAKLRRERLEPELAAVTVSEAEVEARYGARPSEFTKPGRVRAAILRISVPSRARPEKKHQLAARAAEAREAALGLPDATHTFGSVAVKYSDDQATRYRGGDTGWIEVGAPRTRWEPEVMDALFSLREPGEVAPTVTTGAAHYLVRLIGRENEILRPLAEVAPQIRHQLLVEKKAATEQRFQDELRKTIAVSVNEERLRSVPAPRVEETAAARPPSLPE